MSTTGDTKPVTHDEARTIVSLTDHEIDELLSRYIDQNERDLTAANATLTALNQWFDEAMKLLGVDIPGAWHIQKPRFVWDAITSLTQDRDTLAAWKAEQLAVESEWSPQSIAKLLHIPPGHSIRAHLQPKIEELKNAAEDLAAAMDSLAMLGTHNAATQQIEQRVRDFATKALTTFRSKVPAP